MALFRNVSDADRLVVHGVPGHRDVPVDGVVDVEDAVTDSYACQPAIWRRVEPAVTSKPVPSPED